MSLWLGPGLQNPHSVDFALISSNSLNYSPPHAPRSGLISFLVPSPGTSLPTLDSHPLECFFLPRPYKVFLMHRSHPKCHLPTKTFFETPKVNEPLLVHRLITSYSFDWCTLIFVTLYFIYCFGIISSMEAIVEHTFAHHCIFCKQCLPYTIA